MASNTTLNPGASGDVIATKERTHDGDATKVQVVTLAGVSGTEGSYTFGDIGGDATNGLDVDVTRVIPGTSATHLGKAEDGAHTTGDTGVALLAVRRDTAAVGSDTDGDYSTLNVNASGRLYTSATVDAALPAGTNNIGDVDVLSIVPGTGATNLGKAEDAVHSSGDVGVMALAVRQNSQSDLGADGDYVPFTVDDSGGVRVSIVAGAGSGGTATADDADFTAGTTQGTIVQGVYESSPTSVTDGDVGAVGITQTRAMKVAIDSGGITGRAEDAAHSSGHEGVVMLAVRRDTAAVGSDTDGDYSTINVDASGRVHVNVGALPASTNTIETVGDVAQDAAVGGNPLLMGGRASTATPSAMSADGDAVYQWLTRNGASVVAGELVDDAAFTPGTSRVHPIGLQADESSTDSIDEGDIGAPRMSLDRKQYVIAHHETSTIYQNGTARTPAFAIIDAATSGNNTLLSAQGSGNKIRVHALYLVAAGTVNARFESGADGTALSGQMNLVANTGFVLPYNPLGWFETAGNALLNLELSAAVSVDGGFQYTVVT